MHHHIYHSLIYHSTLIYHSYLSFINLSFLILHHHTFESSLSAGRFNSARWCSRGRPSEPSAMSLRPWWPSCPGVCPMRRTGPTTRCIGIGFSQSTLDWCRNKHPPFGYTHRNTTNYKINKINKRAHTLPTHCVHSCNNLRTHFFTQATHSVKHTGGKTHLQGFTDRPSSFSPGRTVGRCGTRPFGRPSGPWPAVRPRRWRMRPRGVPGDRNPRRHSNALFPLQFSSYPFKGIKSLHSS